MALLKQHYYAWCEHSTYNKVTTDFTASFVCQANQIINYLAMCPLFTIYLTCKF